jgi:hypothetical protein
MKKLTKVTQVKEKATWFSLENYRECKSFSAADWLLNLWMRSEPWHYYVTPEQPQLLEIGLITSMLDHLRDTPITRANAVPLAKPVRSLCFSDLAERILSDKRQPAAVKIWDEVMSYGGGESRELRAPVNTITTMFDSGHPALVDLCAPDSVLVDAFKAWLKDVRVTQSAVAESKRGLPAYKKYKKWASYGLLPYMDLVIWSKEKGLEITHETMTAIVVPFAEAIGNTRIRDTVAPLAERLMADLSELQALAAMEDHSESQAR